MRATERLPSTKTDLRAGIQLSIPFNNPAIEQQEVQATVGLRQAELQLDQLLGTTLDTWRIELSDTAP